MVEANEQVQQSVRPPGELRIGASALIAVGLGVIGWLAVRHGPGVSLGVILALLAPGGFALLAARLAGDDRALHRQLLALIVICVAWELLSSVMGFRRGSGTTLVLLVAPAGAVVAGLLAGSLPTGRAALVGLAVFMALSSVFAALIGAFFATDWWSPAYEPQRYAARLASSSRWQDLNDEPDGLAHFPREIPDGARAVWYYSPKLGFMGDGPTLLQMRLPPAQVEEAVAQAAARLAMQEVRPGRSQYLYGEPWIDDAPLAYAGYDGSDRAWGVAAYPKTGQIYYWLLVW